ncbi:caspase family protein [uncultured Bacteroides sp.]|uniref:caspase family protein n=1 Tax=uncultured Bacteroides sp. TaxID=162156 RepID=UPI00260F8F7B|nr:caspase family protein [uncultured Bacteroides sp.]
MTRLLLFSAMLFCTLLCKAQKMYVLTVGITDYKEINDLRLCENDASDFGALMQTANADVNLIKGSEATHENIISALRLMFAKAKSDDTVIFFFSGHGYEGGFCCWDMATNSPSLSSSTIGGKTINKQKLNLVNRYYGGLSYAELQVLFRNCRAGKKMVIADACFSGGLRKGNHINASVQSARKGDLIFFLSSRTDETSLEIPDGVNGLFTSFLLNGLIGDADSNSDNVVSLGELFNYVHSGVSEYASKILHSQHPVIWGRFNEDMPVLRIK